MIDRYFDVGVAVYIDFEHTPNMYNSRMLFTIFIDSLMQHFKLQIFRHNGHKRNIICITFCTIIRFGF